MLIACRSEKLSRITLILVATGIAWIMGVRAPRANPFGEAGFAGKGRATLKIERVDRPGPRDEESKPSSDSDIVEVFATMTFGTELSVFQQGLYMRSRFTLPGQEAAGRVTTVLVVDVDRGDGRSTWEPELGSAATGDSPSGPIRARLYQVEQGDGFDATARAGRLDLEASIVTRTAAGFRIRGWLAMIDVGPDGLEDTGDDRSFDLEVTLESVPPPEVLAGLGTAPLPGPVGGVCDPAICWVDVGYYDTFYGYGCSEAVVDDGATSEGCAGESGYDDEESAGCEGDSSTGYDDNGNPTFDSGGTGCEGDDLEGGSSGCEDSGDSTSGCADSGGDASCASTDTGSGCSGCDADAAPSGSDDRMSNQPLRRADVSWVGLVLIGLATALRALAKSRRSTRSTGCGRG